MALPTDPKGFDRTKAFPLKPSGVAPLETFKVFGVTGKLLGEFTDKTKAEQFQATVPLDKAMF